MTLQLRHEAGIYVSVHLGVDQTLNLNLLKKLRTHTLWLPEHATLSPSSPHHMSSDGSSTMLPWGSHFSTGKTEIGRAKGSKGGSTLA